MPGQSFRSSNRGCGRANKVDRRLIEPDHTSHLEKVLHAQWRSVHGAAPRRHNVARPSRIIANRLHRARTHENAAGVHHATKNAVDVSEVQAEVFGRKLVRQFDRFFHRVYDCRAAARSQTLSGH